MFKFKGFAAPDFKPMTDQVILALTTCPDEASAQAIAAALVQERLATCVNRIGGVRSTYLWSKAAEAPSTTPSKGVTFAGDLWSKAAEALSTTPSKDVTFAGDFWDARLQDEAEILLIMKTTAGRLDELRTRLGALHPYELPELVAIAVTGGNERYLDWVRMGVRRKDEADDKK